MFDTKDPPAVSTHPRDVCIRALETYRGDNLSRARWAFKGTPPEDMQKEYGQSGQTRAAILAGYEQHDSEVAAAIAWVKSR